MKAPTKKYDEALINFFDDEIVGHADTVFRFALALTMSVDQAMMLTRNAYQGAASNLEKMEKLEGSSAVEWLLKECWGAHSQVKGAKGQEVSSAQLRVLKGMPPDGRAALVAVDVAGLSVAEAMRVFGWSEGELRQKLAQARKVLVTQGM